ncbi:cytidine deaminase [Cytophagaceae bacterium DM2B3-1]|uniref:Cytidine deaminase n=1 Tax=Xanthocytophaga flava TaxID=3048013 RepID=A0ABT7CQ17_9BACT|nr:cytidine deaminase [Xanthocytophaga flavus]MDJ1495841.1 cytidine deaminase [Xanthocytophaga flavus]
MRKINLEISVEIFDWDELSDTDKMIMRSAQEALQSAYAPYSNFHVGAAVLLEDGTIIKGSNQENAAYPSGLCAERTAIFATGANYPGQIITAIAVTAKPASSPTFVSVSPCGACRQALLEYEYKQQKSIRMLLQGADNTVCVLQSIDSLLPIKFTQDNLG